MFERTRFSKQNLTVSKILLWSTHRSSSLLVRLSVGHRVRAPQCPNSIIVTKKFMLRQHTTLTIFRKLLTVFENATQSQCYNYWTVQAAAGRRGLKSNMMEASKYGPDTLVEPNRYLTTPRVTISNGWDI